MRRKKTFRTPLAFRYFFAAFLEQEGCFSKFEGNISSFRNFDIYCKALYSHGSDDPSFYIKAVSGAFLWNDTAEGFNYWRHVDANWQKFLFTK